MTTTGFARFISCLLLLVVAGCSQAGAPTSNTATEPPAADLGVAANPAELTFDAAMTAGQVESTAAEPEPAEGTPAWYLREIQKVRLLPLPVLASAEDSADENADSESAIAPASATSESPKVDLAAQIAQTRAIRRERNQQIVKLATDAIRLTAKDPAQETLFLAAVQQLLDAHLQLALQGDEDSIAALYDAAEAFHAKRPNSPAASEAQITVVNLVHANALRYAKAEPRWIQELSRQAQLFASRFPDEQARALPLLMAAGRSCELNGFADDAKSCYMLIQTNFADTPQAQQSAGVLRRMSLLGQPLQMAGPALDGNYLTIDDYAGKAVVVVFWATHAKLFVDELPKLQGLMEKYKKYAGVLSVNLDTEESAVDAFLEETHLTWPVIFHAESDKRGWNAPLALHYGVTSVPTIWIVDPKGMVAETSVSSADLEPKLRAVILKHREETAKGAASGNAATQE